MKRMHIYVLCVFTLMLAVYFMFAGFSYQVSVSLAYVDTQRLIEEYGEFVEAYGKLDAEREKLENEFKEKQDEFVKRREEFDKDQLLWSENKRQRIRQELDVLFREINEFGNRHFGAEGTIARLNSELTNPIVEKVQKIIEKIGADLNYDYIIDKNPDVVLFAKAEHDITDLVLDELNK